MSVIIIMWTWTERDRRNHGLCWGGMGWNKHGRDDLNMDPLFFVKGNSIGPVRKCGSLKLR